MTFPPPSGVPIPSLALRSALRRLARACAATAPIVLAFALAAPAGASAAPRTAVGDPFAGQAFNILSPGEFGGLPTTANSTDQAALYDALTPLQGNVTAADLSRYYKSERFGVQGAVAKVEQTGRPGLTILRDRFGVPHVYGKTRDDVMFGAGWAAIEDRGLLMEQGRGPARVAMLDVPGLNAFGLVTSLRKFTPSAQAEAFVAQQVNMLRGMGAKGRRVVRDFQYWVDGINAWYATRPAASRPAPWTLNDAFSEFAFIGSIFGRGGGDEVRNSDLLASLQARLGAAQGRATFNDLREVNDPSAPTTIPNSFPYNTVPSGQAPGAGVIDPGSISATAQAASRVAAASRGLMSNALLVGAKRSASGHPLAVMGPQIGYFYPELLMELDLHGGGIDARGAAPPTEPYVLIGRGKDFAWSLTSATNDDTDQFLEQLCNQDGSAPTRASTSYMYKGKCTPMTTFDAGLLAGAGSQPAHEVTYLQTVHGPVGGTVTIGGKPYAVATDRANHGRDPVSALALADLNSNQVHSPQTFFKAANEFETTFNWFYVDSKNIAYFSSGRLPVRAPGTDPSLPTLGTGQYDWRGFLSQNQHPHALNPASGTLLNWNNKPAPNWGAADNNWSQGSVHRVQLFTGFKPKGNKLQNVVSVMNHAATQDLRAVLVWPTIQQVLAGGPAPSPLAQQAADLVTTWSQHGASRLDTTGSGKITDPGAAVLDAAWPGMADAVLRPVLGPVTDQFAQIQGSDNAANSGGSSYGGGWYGYVKKDLQSQLGRSVAGPFSRHYCGNGDLAACRASLWAAIQAAATKLAASQGNDPTAWRSDASAERIKFLPGLIALTLRWTNRPTFQQAITFKAHR